jgi:DNA-binding transcriptional LysR family regulator
VDELNRIDWNLLPTLDALLRERNVSRAARALSISQPAASGALARLRRHFGDDLLVRRGGHYDLTPTALRLVEPVRETVASLHRAMQVTESFDPSASTREFVLVASEYGQILFGSDLVRRLAEAAPHARLAFRGLTIMQGLPDWLGTVDGWIGPRDAAPGTPSSGISSDRWVCVVDRDNPAFGDELPLTSVQDHPWIVPTVAQHRDLPWRQRLLAHGLDLNIAVTTESFGAVPHLVAGTGHIGLVQESLIAALGERASGVRVLESPWPMPPLAFTMWWHESREHDLAHAWFRAQVADCLSADRSQPGSTLRSPPSAKRTAPLT